ncbi:MAG: hypothetical protein AAF430_11560 [Myxococcota bacterium]
MPLPAPATAEPLALRRAYLEDDRAQVRALLVGMGALALIYVPLEWHLYRDQAFFLPLMAVRSMIITLMGALLLWTSRVDTPADLDRIMAVQLAGGVALVIAINVLYRTHFGVDLLLIMAIYIALPARLLYQALGAGALSLADVAIDQFVMAPDPNDAVATHLFANALGIGLRLRQLRLRRSLYESAQSERESRVELEQALNAVQQLSGLLPICAVCKKIRDEAEVWHPLESYIDTHSDAQFTHCYCPDCAKRLTEGTEAG